MSYSFEGDGVTITIWVGDVFMAFDRMEGGIKPMGRANIGFHHFLHPFQEHLDLGIVDLNLGLK